MGLSFLLTLLVVFTLFALSLDAGLWYFDHRSAQNQAEAAALAAALTLPASSTAAASLAADTSLVDNRSKPGDRTCFEVSDVSGPAGAPDGLWDTVRVCVRRPSPGLFSALSGIPFVWVGAAASAAVVEHRLPYALMAMDSLPCEALTIHSGARVQITDGVGTYTRSACAPDALDVRAGSTLSGAFHDVVGGGAGSISPDPTEGARVIPDPYADFAQPLPSATCTMAAPDPAPLQPGTYCTPVTITTPRKLSPGIYIFQAGLRVLPGGSLDADLNDNGILDESERVLLYSTCPSSPCNGDVPGDLVLAGPTRLQGAAAQHHIVLWIDRTAGPGAKLELLDNAVNGVTGRLYAIQSEVAIAGTGATSASISVVGGRIQIHGGMTLTLPHAPLLSPTERGVALVG